MRKNFLLTVLLIILSFCATFLTERVARASGILSLPVQSICSASAPCSIDIFNILSGGVCPWAGPISGDGQRHNYSAVGGHSANMMTGGGYQLWPGVLATNSSAAPTLAAAHAYPNPFMPNSNKGHTHVTFTDLPAQVTIKIFSINGRLVQTLTKDDSGNTCAWDPMTGQTNTATCVASGQDGALASGVYIFTYIQPGAPKKQGKLIIIR